MKNGIDSSAQNSPSGSVRVVGTKSAVVNIGQAKKCYRGPDTSPHRHRMSREAGSGGQQAGLQDQHELAANSYQKTEARDLNAAARGRRARYAIQVPSLA